MKTESCPESSVSAIIAPTPVAPRPLSRQRLWQIKMREQGRCWRCGDAAVGSLCPAHLVKERERQRRINGFEARHLNSRSYIFAGANPAGVS